MPVVKRDGADLYWVKQGSGPALILGAGLGGAGAWWEPNLAVLAERFTVYLFDQRGTGRSSKVPVSSIEQMSADLVAIMDAAELEAAHYLGHSTGGAIGVATALDYPERLRSLMLYASTTCGDAYRRKIFGLRRRLLEELGVDAYTQYTSLLLYPSYWINANHERVAAMERQSASQLGPAEIQSSRLEAILHFDRRAELHRIQIPTMVVCADDDVLTPRYFSEEYARLIPGARALWIPRGGHALSQTEPEVFNQMAVRFFGAVPAP
jgi:aminoacrylate hydrolase